MRRSEPYAGEQGFTLIEVLVALSIFSLAVLALMNVAGQNTRTAGLVDTRVLAEVVAENRAVEALTTATPPPVGEASGAEAAGGRLWRWTRKVTTTSDPAILRVDLAVTPEGAKTRAASLTVFRGAR
jgi:general secretion pathway protein I